MSQMKCRRRCHLQTRDQNFDYFCLKKGCWVGFNENGFCFQSGSLLFSYVYSSPVSRCNPWVSVFGCWCWLSAVPLVVVFCCWLLLVLSVVWCRLLSADCRLSVVTVSGCRWFQVVGSWLSEVGCGPVFFHCRFPVLSENAIYSSSLILLY
jgi:hypothetical protein